MSRNRVATSILTLHEIITPRVEMIMKNKNDYLTVIQNHSYLQSIAHCLKISTPAVELTNYGAFAMKISIIYCFF